MTQFAHIQLSKQQNATIYSVPASEVSAFLDEMISEGIDVSGAVLLRIS